jgi:hypothetical protein
MTIRHSIVALAVLGAHPLHAQYRLVARSGASVTAAAASPAAALWQPTPRRSRGARVALQFLASSAGAAGGGLGTYLIMHDMGKQRVKGDEGYSRAGNVGYLVGSFAGATLGAQLVGNAMGGTSPVWATALGALIGTLPLATLGVDEPFLPLYGIILGWIPQGGLATVGYAAGERR